jgi:hypothetical protein
VLGASTLEGGVKASAEQLVRAYLSRMAEIRSTGGATSETSHYFALEMFLNEIGRTLDPAVICNGQLRNQGAGHPDFGLYSKKQCQSGEPKPGQGEIPERGVIEVKPLADDTWQTARGKQATKYFQPGKPCSRVESRSPARSASVIDPSL